MASKNGEVRKSAGSLSFEIIAKDVIGVGAINGPGHGGGGQDKACKKENREDLCSFLLHGPPLGKLSSFSSGHPSQRRAQVVPGFRIKKRSQKTKKIPQRHKIGKEEAILFAKEHLKVKIAEEMEEEE